MESNHPLIAYCRRDLEVFQRRLREMESGRMKFGTSRDGVTWDEITSDEIAYSKAKITELTAYLAEYATGQL